MSASTDKPVPPQLNAELERYFAKVQNPDNWKRAIAAFCSAEDLAQTIRAIEYFTGGKTLVSWDGRRNQFYLVSPGYYAVCGA